jgi:hypothetical protein
VYSDVVIRKKNKGVTGRPNAFTPAQESEIHDRYYGVGRFEGKPQTAMAIRDMFANRLNRPKLNHSLIAKVAYRVEKSQAAATVNPGTSTTLEVAGDANTVSVPPTTQKEKE